MLSAFSNRFAHSRVQRIERCHAPVPPPVLVYRTFFSFRKMWIFFINLRRVYAVCASSSAPHDWFGRIASYSEQKSYIFITRVSIDSNIYGIPSDTDIRHTHTHTIAFVLSGFCHVIIWYFILHWRNRAEHFLSYLVCARRVLHIFRASGIFSASIFFHNTYWLHAPSPDLLAHGLCLRKNQISLLANNRK